MKNYQIIQNYGKGSFGYLYLKMTDEASEEEIMEAAKKAVKQEWDETKNNRFGLHIPKPAAPTLIIKEYDTKTHARVKGGLELKTKWR